jgi:methylglutaconyl-CoA hydratase
MYETIEISTDTRGITHLWLNRPEKHNTLSGRMIEELTGAAAELGADPDVRVVILGGRGDSFCAGGDLDWMRAQIAADDQGRRAGARSLAMMLRALDRMPKPLIGRIHGQAFGGGVGMMSVCDLTVGVRGPMFGLTETKLGLIPATISPYVIARMGITAARRHFLASRLFDADEAHRIGLLSALADPGELDAVVMAEAEPFLACAPGAVADAKALIRTVAPGAGETLVETTIGLLVDRWKDPESAEGIAAFFERRKPRWSR